MKGYLLLSTTVLVPLLMSPGDALSSPKVLQLLPSGVIGCFSVSLCSVAHDL